MAELSPDAFGFSAAAGPKELDPSAFGFGPGRAVAQPERPAGGLVAAAKQAIGSTIKGAGQAASDFIPGVTTANPVTTYGQGIIDANPTAVQSLGDIVESPWMATKEAIGNAAGSMAGMVGSALGAKALGGGLSAVAPFTGPAAPVVGGVGKLVSTFGPGVAPIVTAALPSYGGIREEQIKADHANEADARSKAIAALGAGTVGAIETRFGPQDWALSAMKKGGIEAVAKKFADAKSIPGAIGKGILHGGAVEGAEELVQNPIEQLASYQDPTSRQAVGETLFGGAMGALGGGALGGGMAGVAKAMTPEQPVVTLPGASPTVAQTSTAPTTAVQPNVAPQPATVSAPIEINPAAGPLQAATVAGIQSGAVQPAVTTNQVANEANQVDAGSAVTVAQATGQGEAPVQEASVPAASGLSGYARAPEVGAATFDRSTTPKNGGYGATENSAQPVVAESANAVAPTITPIGLAGEASAGQAATNTPAAPEIPPVSTAAPTTQTKQAETAGVPTSLRGEIQSNANQTEEAVTPASGREAQPAAVSGSGVAPAKTDLAQRIGAFVAKAGDVRLERLANNANPALSGAARAEIARRAGMSPKSVSGTSGNPAGTSDMENDAAALATQAARLRESASRAIGSQRAKLTALADRMDAARSAIVAQSNAPAPKKSQVGSRQSPIMRRNDLVGAIMRVTGGNGIASVMAQDIAGDKAGSALAKLRGLFTNRGVSDLGDVAMLLREEEGFDVRDGNHLAELIRRASSGDVAVSMERAARDADADQEKRHRDRIRSQAKKYGVKTQFVKFSDLEARVLKVMEQRHDKAVAALDDRAKKRFDAELERSYSLVSEDEVDAVLVDVNGRGFRGRSFWNESTKLLRGMNDDAVARQMEEAIDAAVEGPEPDWLKDDDGRGNQPTGGGDEADRGDQAEAPGFGLAGQSAEDVARQEADRVAAEKAAKEEAEKEAAEKAAAEKKSIADKIKERAENPDNFQFGEDAKAAAKPMGGLFDQPENHQKSESASEPPMKKGDRFTDGAGNVWEVWMARTGLIEAHPVVNGKPVVNRDSGVRFATTSNARLANPEARTDFTPMAKEKNPVTPQLMVGDPERYIKVAADSIGKLRKDDVYRVLIESNQPAFRADIARYIKKNRPDLAAEVDSVLAEESASSAEQKSRTDREPSAEPSAQSVIRATIGGQPEAVPPAVLSRIKIALNRLREVERELAGVERARGRGHILALEVRDQQSAIKGAQAKLAEFRKMAPGNNIDAEAVIASMGGEPDFSRFGKPAEEVIADSQDYEEGDEIAFTPHAVSNLAPAVSGILTAKQSTGNGRFRLTIRTDKKAPQGGGNVTVTVYSQNGKVDRIGDGLNKPQKPAEPEQRSTINQAFEEGQKKVVESESASQPGDFNAMFNDIMGEISPEESVPATPKPSADRAPSEEPSAPRAPRTPRASRPTRTAGEAAASAASNLAGGFGDITNALGALFGTKSGGRLSTGLSFDEDTYAKALPLFKSAVSKFNAAGKDLRELMKALMLDVQRKFGSDALRNMQPYVVRFMEDVQAGKISLEEQNVTDKRGRVDLERDSQNPNAENGLGEKGVLDGSEPNGRSGEPGVSGAEANGGAGSGGGISGHEALATGAASDNAIYTGASELSPGSAGNSVSVGSGDLRLDGPPIEPEAAKGIDAAATSRSDLARKVALQSRAPTSPDASIADALPILSEGQQDDVAKAEKRFAAPDGYGMLFTNGTGTGKTFTGLGIVKRHVNAGKGNILIVVPNDKIIEDWQKSGQLLGLTISALANTKDAGKGVVITTYANMGQNSELAKRDWDLVVHDEAHHLMENAKTEATNSLKTLRAITLHPDGAYQRHAMLNGEGMARLAELDALAKSERMSDDERNWLLASATQAKADKLRAELRDKESAIKADVAARQGADRPRALFLSFTPFAYEPSIDWANGYLFDYNEGRPSEEGVFRGYNEGSNREQFFMQHFGYRMRTGKLNKPDAKVDAGLMQRQFNGFLKKKGSLSGRMLDVDADYDRRFVLVDSAIGARIDEALEWFENKEDETNDKTRTAAMRDVRKIISEKFDYLSRRYLLEAIKAQEVIPHIREHLAMGRKVVVFHDYNKGGGFNPFDLSERAIDAEMSESGDAEAINGIIREFRTEFKDLISSDLFKASSPITNFQIEFPGILLVNGSVPAKVRRENVAKFQDDASGPQVILVQAQAGKEGISLHDTTGKHQRVLFNLGQPTQPTMAMQQEGRIYRMGQVSDAIIRYLNTGTNWEKWAFATTIAQRASAAENLGSGEMARAIKDAFISGFEESGDYRAGMEGEGKGGKDRDKAANDAISEYDRAKAFYFGTQKKDARSKSREGTDYYATPEPIGLKMVEFADIRPGDDVMEPSAGHGAIARWFSEQSKRTAIEPSSVLRARLAMVFDGNIIGRDFESLNVVNKFDAIVMNPPFGVGGKTAIDHLTKAATHLRNGGRIVAILPTGPAADKKLDKWLNEGEEKPIKPLVVHPTLGPIYFGDTISTRSDFNAVVERALSNDTIVAKEPSMPSGTAHLVRSIVKIDPTGNRSRTEGANKGLYLIADMQLPSVTFERASTAVRAHIVVLEKQTDQAKLNTVPQQINRDYTDAADIGELFTRMENAFVRPRENARKEEDSTQNPVSEAKGPAGKVQPVGAEATVEKVLPGGKLLTDAPVVTYTTKAGKKLEGVIAKGLQKDGAKAIDPFTWAKDGGFFIRLKHVVRPKEESGGDDAIRYNVASTYAGRGPIFSFAGQQSATADKFQLDRAQQLLADGADAEAVRQQTGWFKGADGKWRYEIDDSGASLKAHGFGFGELLDAIGKSPKLADVLDHPALFAAYPSIAGASVEAFDEKSQNNGELVANKGGRFTIRVNAGLGEAKALSVLLHEIQHGIQNVEGFASGGSPDTMASFDNPQIRTLEDKISALMASSKPGKQVAKEVAEINAKIADLRRENPYSAYRRLAGEVEARNVQARQNFSADRRKYANPDETADTARADVIVVFNGKAAASAPAPANARPSAAGATGVSPADSAIYSMAQEGKSAAEILSFIGKASRRPFNRYLANALRNLGAASTITLDSQGGFAFGNRSYAQKYAAAYNPKTDTVTLFTPRSAETHVLHEFVHAATLKAIANGGPASMRMRALFRHVQKSGALDGQYGMSNLDEFVAEAFSNPKFQQALKAVPAPKGSTLKSAWQWFVQAVARILGLRTTAMETALDRAMTEGAALMRENAELAGDGGAARFSLASAIPETITINGVERPTTNSNGKPIHPTAEGLRNFWKWFGDSKIVDEQGRPLVVYHSTLDGRLTEFGRTGKFMGYAGVSGISVTDNPSAASRYLDRYAEYGWVDGRPNQPFDKHVLPLYAKANNPLYRNEPIQTRIKMGFPLPNGYVNPLISDGYDALIRDDAISRSGPVKHSSAKNAIKGQEIIVFSPEQLKSATGNRGTFDATDPDIRYNLAADWQTAPSRAATTIRQYVADSMRSDSNTSWLTPFNTQYHKAEKWAAEGKVRFKRVFDLVQRFLGDVSKFAVMAQNEAPTLFHEWRTLADVKRTLTSGDVLGNQHRADVAAIASPLYEGTLYGGGNPLSGIRWSDDQLRNRFNLTDRQIKLYHEALAAVKVSMDEMAKSIVAQHAKRVGVDFDEGMSLEDMVADVSNRMEELQDEIQFQFLSEEAEESVAASVENYLEMDMEEEAQKTRANFEKQKKAAQAQIEQIDKTMEDIKAVESKNVALQKAGYFPLMRFGKHTVTAKDADGKVQFFGMYEGVPLVPRSGQYEANKVAAELRAEFPEWTVTTGIKNDEKYKLYQGLNIEAIQLFADHMDKEDLEPFQEFIRLATNNRSAQRRLLHRQGTPGFDRDVRRTLAQFVVSNARATSSNYHTQDMLRAAADAEKDGGDIGAEAVKLVEYVRNPAEEAQALRGFLFFNFLGGSLASAAVNLTQTPMMTLPFLSKFESAQRVTRRLMAAAKMAAGNPESLPAGKLRDALLRAEMDGVTAPQEIHQLTATAANNIFAGSRLANGLLRGWGAPFAMAESFNRRIAFIAAFQIAESMSPAELAKTGFKDAFEFAEDAVKQTQGIYNKGNRMNVGRGSVGSVLMTFKQYSIMYLELLKRLPPKQRAIMVGVLLLAAGGGGLPGVEDVEDLIDTIGQWLGFATNSRRALRNTLTEWVGRDGSDIVLNGLLSRMGIDLHSRMGMQNLIPGSGILKQSSVDKGRDIEEFFGPAASVVKSLGDALESLATGHPGRAGMALAPGAVRNVVQGAKMAATGYAEDAKGRRTVPVNELESAAKMVGFNPKSVADYGTVKRDIAQDQRLVGVKREEFTSAIADAILSGDTEARKQAMSDMAQWNRDNPTLRFTIAPGAIVRRVKEARTEGATRFLKAVPKGMRSQAIEEMRQ